MTEPAVPTPTPPARRRSGPLALVVLLALAIGGGFLVTKYWHGGGGETAPRTDVPGDWRPAKLPESSAIDFRLPTVDGRQMGPADFRGQVVIVDFWATWCLPCHLQADILTELHKQRGDSVRILSVDVAEPPQVVKDFLATSPVPYPVLVDADDQVNAKIGVEVLPTVMVLDREGRVVYLRGGIADIDLLAQVLEKAGA